MLNDPLAYPLLTAQTGLLLLGGFYLLAGLWLSLAPCFFKQPGLIVVSVEQLPLEHSFTPEGNRARWQRLFQMVGAICLALCLICWSLALSL